MTPDPSGITVQIKPGGLTTNEHILHAIVAFCTGGLWLPGYAAFYLFAPLKRVEVWASAGVDPQLVARRRMEAEALTPVEQGIKRQRVIVVACLLGAWLLVCGGACAFFVTPLGSGFSSR